MNDAILKKLHQVPRDIDLIVGIPRSGMLPANLLSLYLNVKYTDIDSFIEGRVYGAGQRGDLMEEKSIKKILVIDDSVLSGYALRKAKDKLNHLSQRFDFLYGVVYATDETKKHLDFYCEVVPTPRVFQWNIFHHTNLMKDACFDLDGVMCVDPPVDDDGEQYLAYITDATPLYIPSVNIGTIVTCRLEKYRKVTEEWLCKHGVKYDKLVMLPFANKEERMRWGQHGAYKGKEYKKRESSNLFVESNLSQALEISRVSNKPVFCTETFSMVNSESSYRNRKIKNGIKLLLPASVKRMIIRLISRFP